MTVSPPPSPTLLRALGLVLLVGAAAATAGCASETTSAPQASRPDASAPDAMLSLDTPVERIAAAPGGKALLDRDLPGLTTHPEYAMFKSMNLRTLAGMSNGKLTQAQLTKVQADLAKLTRSDAGR